MGFLVGCVDEVLVSYEFTEKHYLTAGLLGSGMTQKLELPYHANEAIGFLAGLLFATGQLNHLLDKAGTPISTAMAAGSYGGPAWAVAGGLCGVLDEGLQSYNFTDKPYLSNTIYGVSAVSLLSSQSERISGLLARPGLKESLGVLAGAVLSSSGNNVNRKSPVKLGQELYALFAELMDKKELDRLIEQQALTLVTSQLVLANLGLMLNAHYQSFQSGLEGIQEKPEGFYDAVSPFTRFALSYFGSIAVSEQVTGYMTELFANAIEDKLSQRYLTEEIPLKLNADNSTRTSVKNMRKNIQEATRGVGILADFMKAGTEGVFFVSFLLQEKSIDLVLFVDSYQQVFGAATSRLSQWQAGYRPRLEELDTQISKLQEDATNKAHLIISSDKDLLLKQKREMFIEEKRALEMQQTVASGLLGAWGRLSGVLDFILKYRFIAQNIVNGKMQFDSRRKALVASYAVSDLASWPSKNSAEIAKIEYATNATWQLLEAMKSTPETAEPTLDFTNTQSDQLALHLNNISFGIDGKTLGTIDSLTLKQGIYAVTGPSGSGKSTFLKKLKGLVHSHGTASGNVRFSTPHGNKPKIALASQEDYLMPYSTLLEIMLSNSVDIQDLHERAQTLAREIELGKEDLLETKSDWSLELSGGQKKKLAILSIIMQDAEIVILDEVFNGMDTVSLAKAQEMLKKYLPNSLILAVDHEYKAHNTNDFYEQELRLEDGVFRLLNF